MCNNDGYILLARSIFSGKPFDTKEPETRKSAYIDLALMANFADRDGLKRGQLATTYRQLATRWGWSIDKTFRFIETLEKDGLLEVSEECRTESRTQSRTQSRTLLTLVKYDFQRFTETECRTERRTETRTNHERQRKEAKEKERLSDYLEISNPQGKLKGEIKGNIPPIYIPPTNTLKERFERIWKQYPRKLGKDNAFRDYSKAISEGVTDEEIELGLVKYNDYIRLNHTEPQYILHGSTWFHQRRWTDDYSAERKPTTADIADKFDFNNFFDGI